MQEKVRRWDAPLQPLWQSLFVPWTDARAATDMARLQGLADKNKTAVAIDDIVTFVPRRARQTARAESTGRQEGRGKRSTVGLLKDLARKYVIKASKLGFKDVVDRMENDALFAYSCSLSNINIDGMMFLERLSRAIFPNFGRSFEERAKGTGKAGRKAEPMEFDDLSVKLVFIPRQDKPADEELTIATETFIAFRSRFFSINQFVHYLKRFILGNPREEKPIIYGWRARQFVPEGETDDMLKDLTNFALMNWPDAAVNAQMSSGAVEGEHERVRLTKLTTANESERTAFDPIGDAEQTRKGKKGGKGKGKGDIQCFECGGPHLARDCPNRKGKGEGKGKGDGKGQGGKPKGKDQGKTKSKTKVEKGGGKHNGYPFTWFWSEAYWLVVAVGLMGIRSTMWIQCLLSWRER